MVFKRQSVSFVEIYILDAACRDGHPEFKARKSLQFIVDDLKSQQGFEWVRLNKTMMFDDDRGALAEDEADRLVPVGSYDHWAPCDWYENVNEELLARNPDRLADIVRARYATHTSRRVGICHLAHTSPRPYVYPSSFSLSTKVVVLSLSKLSECGA